MFLNNFLGIQPLPDRAQALINKFLLLSLAGAFLGNLSSTFFILYVINSIGYAKAGIVTSFILFVQLITDYPSGSLGDYIGQRWVLAIANICYAISYFLLAITTTFSGFLLLAIFQGFGNAQASGALGTWLDNNYRKVVANSDPGRKIYGFSQARIGSINRIVMAGTFIIGGIIATNISREAVFFLQATLSFFLLFLILFIVKDVEIPVDPTVTNHKPSMMGSLIGGLRFFVSSKTAFFFLLGSALVFTGLNVWGQLILFPIYFGYSGTDSLASTFRSIMFLVGIPIGIYMARVSMKFANKTLPLWFFLTTFLYYIPFIALLTFLPPENSFSPLGLLLTALLLTFSVNCLFDVSGTLNQRTLVDLVPSDHRNAVYSLIPTLISIFGIPFIALAGQMIENSNFDLRAGILVAFSLSLLGSFCVFLSFHFKPEQNLQSTEF
jgi:MFS family permease